MRDITHIRGVSSICKKINDISIIDNLYSLSYERKDKKNYFEIILKYSLLCYII